MRATLRLILCCTALSLSACGTEELDLDSLPIADEAADEKADGAVTYQWVRPSPGVIRCLRAPCESNLNHALNGAEGRTVYAYDLRSLRLSAARRTEIQARMGELLVRGRYTTTPVMGTTVAVFQITRAMEPVSERGMDSPTEDRYFNVTGTSACQGSCPLVAKLISGGSATSFETVNLQQLGLKSATETALRAEMPKGYVHLSVRTVSGGAARVTQAFRSIFAPAL